MVWVVRSSDRLLVPAGDFEVVRRLNDKCLGVFLRVSSVELKALLLNNEALLLSHDLCVGFVQREL